MEVTLSGAVRKNLLSLQNTAASMANTQNRLSTGKRVNSALDNPTNFFTAASLGSRASDLSRLQDSVSNAVQTIEAADNGLKAITKLVESAQGTARQALQSTKAEVVSLAKKDGSSIRAGGDATSSDPAKDADLDGSIDISYDGGAPVTINFEGKSLNQIVTEISGIHADVRADLGPTSVDGKQMLQVSGDELLTIVDNTDDNTGLAEKTGLLKEAPGERDIFGKHLDHNEVPESIESTDIASLTGAQTIEVDINGAKTEIALAGSESFNDIANKISDLTGLTATVETGENAGEFKLSIKGDDSVKSFAITGDAADTLGISGALTQDADLGANSTRTNLENQYNDLLKQIDQLSNDASFNGNNFLVGDDMKVLFNEKGTSSLTIQGVDTSSKGLGLDMEAAGNFQSNDNIENTLKKLEKAISSLRSNASTFGSNMSIVETRQEFTKNMINTLETGASNLTLADMNREGANMLALQTRQQLSTTALSMASQADQAVLRLF